MRNAIKLQTAKNIKVIPNVDPDELIMVDLYKVDLLTSLNISPLCSARNMEKIHYATQDFPKKNKTKKTMHKLIQK